ncbi:response regulator [Vibrio navarrensis]|uniref:response regulator n=1 Tax=Vibrio navarrensis TaxID=29495 RepID=UPI001559E6EA|nr:response regulator [Vibrio navarrensis]
MKYSKTSIFIFYNSFEVLDMVKGTIGNEFDSIFTINIEIEQENFIHSLGKNHHAILYIYAFDDPEYAKSFSLLLKQHSALSSHHLVPCESVLMCPKEYRKQAFELCESGFFYTYETIKPIYDTNKIRLTLKRLAQHLTSDALLALASKQNAQMETSIESSIQSIDTLKSTIHSQHQDNDKMLDSVLSPLDQLLYDVPTNVWRKALSNALASIPTNQRNLYTEAFDLSTFKDNLDNYKKQNQSLFGALSQQLDSLKPQVFSTKPLIIVADDQPVMQKIISSILQPRGFKVELAGNGVEAIMKAKVMIPNLVLLDIDMPTMDGLSTLQAFKKLDVLKDVPVIMLTSHSDKQMFKQCIEHGAIDYVVKPTKADTLLKKVYGAIT